MKDKKHKLSPPLKLLIYFFGVILIFSVISSFTSSAVVPQVTAVPLVRNSLVYTINSIGVVSSSDDSYIPVSPDYRISEVYAEFGDSVSNGDALFSYDTDDIREKQKELSDEISTLEAEIEKTKLEREKTDVKSGFIAEENDVRNAQHDLDYARENLEDAISTWQEQMKDNYDEISKECVSASNNDEKVISAQRALEDAQREYIKAVNKYSSALYAEEQDNDSIRSLYFECSDAEKGVARAQDDLDRALENQDNNDDELRDKLSEAERIYMESLEETPDNITSAGKKSASVTSARQKVKEAEKALADSKLKLEQKRKETVAENQNEIIDGQTENISDNLSYKKLDDKRKKLSELDKLIENEGKVFSNTDGVISSIDVHKGKTSSSDSIVSIATDKYCIKGKITEKEAKLLNVGDVISVNYNSNDMPVKCEITAIGGVDADGNAEITADFERENSLLNAKVSFSASVNLGTFEGCVPYQALHMDQTSKYVLVIREKEGILGTELEAERVDVEVTASSSTMAAIYGPLLPDDLVIISSSKTINSGDKVRYHED